MKIIIALENEFGSIHVKTSIKNIDIENDFSRCAYCSLENECMSKRIKCNEKYLYQGIYN